MRITSKGQVTIPQAIREKSGLLPHCEVEFRLVRGQVVIAPLAGGSSKGRDAVAKVRGSLKHLGMTTDELLALTRGQ
ncbi:MAG: AbrB/MazE/SpoVT family DNA-binding domain-containing protein [Betaproteobacteria bacterium]|nr:AbrB/MazE/SpoVT family DNA-binding domain-containing protein [Betaproteobacteria bacterium]